MIKSWMMKVKKMSKLLRKIKNFVNKGYSIWFPNYCMQKIINLHITPTRYPIHIVLCVVDHFEPFSAGANLLIAQKRVNAWLVNYPKMADKHIDADGKKPQHTWFYPPHLDQSFLKDIVSLCKCGYGDVEMHLHHNHMDPFPDTCVTLKQKIMQCLNDYSKYGIFVQPNGKKKFAFIHGDWSLDNSLGLGICGINNEISILRDCGCYADFTFPSLGKAQPAFINKVYYAKDNEIKAKSYNWGKQVVAGDVNVDGDLLMVQGIIGLRWFSRTHAFIPSIESSNLDASDVPTFSRLDYLIKNAITIKRFPMLRFIKLHTHGARESTWDALFGKSGDNMFSYLESKYNDGNKYVLHYVTAREMYNIIKTVEAGTFLNVQDSRNSFIGPYCYV